MHNPDTSGVLAYVAPLLFCSWITHALGFYLFYPKRTTKLESHIDILLIPRTGYREGRMLLRCLVFLGC